VRKLLISMAVVTLFAGPALCAEAEVPWWKQQKIRVMWGQWAHAREDKSKPFHDGDLPRELFRNVAQSGGTVFVEHRGGCKPNHARFAHEFGMKYFATLYVNSLPNMSGGRRWVKESGEDHWFKCPLDEGSYERWLVEPHLEGARQGLIDGIHIDWEAYGGHGEATGICYCDDCFSKFPPFQESGQELPEKVKRFPWVTERDLVAAYEENFSKRRVEMFTHLRQKLQAAKSDLLFSSYGTLFSDFTRAMNTPATPFIFLDCRHYYNDDRQAWWESYGSRLREEGYLYIPGGWTNALFGAQASQVSAARWIYEASINEDGCWLWFERELDDEILRAYATADRELSAVQSKVGNFLFGGTRDPNFVTVVEWTGRPELERAVITAGYHLDDKHLLHVNNVDTEWPLRVRLRFPRLPEGDRWTVRDAMNDLYYTHDGTSAEWTRDDLLAGVVVALEPRSDLFLVLSPPGGNIAAPSALVHSRQFDVLPDHEAASKQAFIAPAASPAGKRKGPKASQHLVYTATEPMDPHGRRALEDRPEAEAASRSPLVPAILPRRQAHRLCPRRGWPRTDLRHERRRHRRDEPQRQRLLRPLAKVVARQTDDRVYVGPHRRLGHLHHERRRERSAPLRGKPGSRPRPRLVPRRRARRVGKPRLRDAQHLGRGRRRG